MDFDAEEGCLAPFASQLTNSVILSQTNRVKTVKTFFGDSLNPVPALIIDLRNNDFSNGLLEGSFLGLTNVEMLFLGSSNIMFLPQNIFHPILDTLLLLDLINNSLVTIPYNLFEGVSNNAKCSMSVNKLECDCNLFYFTNLVQQTNIFDKNPPLCFMPLDLRFQAIKNISLECSDPTSPPSTESSSITAPSTFTSIETTDPTILTTSTAYSTTLDSPTSLLPSTSLMTLECINYSDKLEPKISETFNIKTRSTNFFIMEDEDRRVYVEINDMCTGSILLWFFNSTFFSNTSLEIEVGTHYGCAIHFEKIIEIPNLIFNQNYIFCLIEPDRTEVSPFDCIAYMLENREESWIKMADRSTVIAVFIVTLAGSLISGAIMMYLCLKLIPYIQMKRNERKESQASEYEDIDYSSTSNNYTSPTAPKQSVHSMAR